EPDLHAGPDLSARRLGDLALRPLPPGAAGGGLGARPGGGAGLGRQPDRMAGARRLAAAAGAAGPALRAGRPGPPADTRAAGRLVRATGPSDCGAWRHERQEWSGREMAGREATGQGTGERERALGAFLEGAGWGAARRELLAADASFRRYDRLSGPEGRAV